MKFTLIFREAQGDDARCSIIEYEGEKLKYGFYDSLSVEDAPWQTLSTDIGKELLRMFNENPNKSCNAVSVEVKGYMPVHEAAIYATSHPRRRWELLEKHKKKVAKGKAVDFPPEQPKIN